MFHVRSRVRSSSLSGFAWVQTNALPSGGVPDIIIDAVNGLYYDGSGNTTLAALVTGTAVVSALGLRLNVTDLAATGALLAALKAPSLTVVAEVFGGTAGTNAGILSEGSNAPIFKTNGNVQRVYNGSNLDTANTADWTSTTFAGARLTAVGRAGVLNLGEIVSNSGTLAAPTTAEIGQFGGALTFGGYLRTLRVWKSALSDAEFKAAQWPKPYLLPYAGANAIKARSGEYVSAGTVLQYERTQAWSMLAVVNIRVQSGASGTGVIFSNVAGAVGAFTGYEAFVDPSNHLHCRIIHDIANNYIGVSGSTNICDGAAHVVLVTYDGSSTAGGVKLYVDGVLETMTVESNTLSASITNSNVFYIANQESFTTTFFLNGMLDEFSMHNVVRDATWAAAHKTPATVVAFDANTVMSYGFDEASGTSVTDRSASGFTGTLSSATMRLA